MHPTIARHIVNDRISTLYRDGAMERLAAQARRVPSSHVGVPTGRPAGVRGWLRIVLRGVA